MTEILRCYRCGESLEALTLPLGRRDECPACENYLHVCRMCRYFDPRATKQCLEDDAEEVINKDTVNFCEWFKPSATAFDPARKSEEDKARNALDSLFGVSGNDATDDDDPLQAAKDLFS